MPRQRYLGGRTVHGSRQRYTGRGTGTQSASSAEKKSGGGGLAGVLKQGLVDLKDVAVNAPAGVYYLGKGLATDPVGTVEDVGKATLEDLRHPLRHPGYTALDILGIAGGAAGLAGRAAAAGHAIEAGETAGRVLRAATHRPAIGPRTLTRGGLEVKVGSSQSPLSAAAQRAIDKTLERTAEQHPGGVADRLLSRKIGKAVTAESRTVQDVHRASGAALIAMGRRLSPAEQKALQVVAEEAPLEGRITATSARVTGARTPKARKRHQAELDLLHAAKPLLGETAGKPVFAVEHANKLTTVLERMREVATSREELLKGLGQLTDEAIQGRKAKAARVALGQPVAHPAVTPPEIPRQAALFEESKADLFAASPEAVRIPDVATRRGVRALSRPGGVGTQGTVGHQRALGSVSHEYTGALREQAVRRQDTTALVGESGMEAAKYAGLRHVHDLVRQAVTPEPTGPGDIAVRLDDLKPNERLPLDVRKFLDNPDEFFARATPEQSASVFDQVRARLFINPARLDADQAADFQRLRAEGKIGWVPKSMLGELAKPHLPYTGKTIGAVDAVNNASRFAILYLKPAYAIPNLLGNAALNVLQQGFAAVPNLARAARLNSRLSLELAARIDTLMGEGFARSISAHGRGAGAAVVDTAASFWSKGVDQPFRRSSFLYEADRLGYKTPPQLERLLTSPEHQDKLVEVAQRANREIIDYANLTPTEREVIRRVVFFYPWVKGSTVYAGRFLREHPVKAAAVGQIGAEGERQTAAALGPVPSYLEGVFPVGGRLANPAAAAILQTPAQVGEALAGLAGGDVGKVGELSNFLSPASALALAAVTRRDRAGYPYQPGTGLGGIAFDQLVKNTPQYTLGQRISDALNGKGGDRLYPPNVRDALLQYIVGGVAPRKFNPEKLLELSLSERSRYRG